MFYYSRILFRSVPVLLTCALLLLCSCDTQPGPESTQPVEGPAREILVYCGITMIQPVMELAALVEREKNCKVKISYGESEWVKDTAMTSKTGDILFPGTPSFLQPLIKDGSINKTLTVGQNRIALMVQKGNPKQVKPDLTELLREDLMIVIGAPDAGSIGHETRNSLTRLGIYDQVVNKALYLTADSKGLSQALRSTDADVVVNWRATAYFKDHNQFMEVIALPDEQAENRSLVMGLLNFSKEKDLAEYFMARAASETGRAIFTKFGF
jgi:molybdate transport system substrate-binding protein